MTIITKEDGNRKLPFDEQRLTQFITSILNDYPHLPKEEFIQKVNRSISSKIEYSAQDITNILTLHVLDYIGVQEGQHPDWTYVAGQIYAKSLYKKASRNRSYDAEKQYGDFLGLLQTLSAKGIYNSLLLKNYEKEEIIELSSLIEPEKDKLFTYIGLRTLAERYLATDHAKNVYELPQERFLVIAMTLMMNEPKEKRMDLVKEAYWALSNLYMTVATPTLSNAGKSYGQLSSCFIDTVDDSLRGIYDSNTDIATLSKNGGGIGVYLGHIRARGSSIKGFKGISSGVVPWIRQLENTAVSVDQLGLRKGSIAVYLDVWHKDIFSFLDLRLNNGDEKLRAHEIFTGVCLPDLFMEQLNKVDENGKSVGEWYLFDPHEVFTVTGEKLQDYFDENVGEGSFREFYWECVNNPNISKERVLAVDVMKSIMKSQLETGTPYMFYRDTVNRTNANGHAGMIYCSNLCSEITQNQSPTTVREEYDTEDGVIVVIKDPGDFVVCNLSSIHLGRAVPDNVLPRLIPIQVRMLDNVIELNTDKIDVLQAVRTNLKYRAIGLGTFSYHHLLALKGIKWESEEAVEYADELYEEIAFLTIQSSMELAKEKGHYEVFEGSDWEDGRYFDIRGYNSLKWIRLREEVKRNGIRNGYLMAVAPNASTSILAGGTASIDPVFKRQYTEEKKDYKIPVTAPDLSAKTFWYYKNAYEVDQKASIRQNAARQRHIDQSQSFNLYVKNDIKAKDLLDLHKTAWKMGLKTTYYVRSTSIDVEDCESCSS